MTNDTMTFQDMGLSQQMLMALEKKGYGYPTTIQQLAIPSFMQWKDVIAKAPTGTGKTCAFGIPMLEYVNLNDKRVQELDRVFLCASLNRQTAHSGFGDHEFGFAKSDCFHPGPSFISQNNTESALYFESQIWYNALAVLPEVRKSADNSKYYTK